MENKLLNNLKKIFAILSENDKLIFNECGLFKFSDKEISTPAGNILPLLLSHKSKLKDQIIEINLLTKLVDLLSKNQSIIRLDHIGFCYKVASLKKEKERIIELISKSNFHLYQEQSSDDGLWLFVGNTDNWENPMIEFVPIEKTNDKWVDYFLPHIQIDIDTNLTSQEIKKLMKSVFNDKVQPFPIVINEIVYIVRNRLGTIGGVNINLDLATNSRNVKFVRQKVFNKII